LLTKSEIFYIVNIVLQIGFGFREGRGGDLRFQDLRFEMGTINHLLFYHEERKSMKKMEI